MRSFSGMAPAGQMGSYSPSRTCTISDVSCGCAVAQIPHGGVPAADLVVRGRWGDRVLLPAGHLQPLLPAPPGAALQAARAPGLQRGARPRMGHQAGAVPAGHLDGAGGPEAVLLGGAWELDPLRGRRLCGGELRRAHQDQVLHDADRLHPHEGRPLR